jgi:hypothetical protein
MDGALSDEPCEQGRRDADRAAEAARDEKAPTEVEATERDPVLEQAEREPGKYVPL